MNPALKVLRNLSVVFITCLGMLSPNPIQAQPACLPLPSGLTHWWPASGDALDIIGGSHGTLSNGALATLPGESGSGFTLGGNNAFVRLPDNVFPFPPAAPVNNPMSFETWFQTSDGGVILGQETGAPLGSINGWVPAIYVGTDARLHAQMFWNGSVNQGVSTTQVNDGVFHHLALTFDGTLQKLYLDGQLIDARPASLVQYGTIYSYQFGLGYTANWPNSNGGWFPFKGLIDEPSIYNRSLSSNEVAAIFTAGSAGKCTSALPPVILQQPAGTEVAPGSNYSFLVAARGNSPLAYQWQLAGTNIPGATTTSLTVSNISVTATGDYTVVVSNAFGVATSQAATLGIYFPITPGQVVSDGAPFGGAGNLEIAGTFDDYRFTAPANLLLSFNVLSAFNRLFWTLTAPDGTTVFANDYLPYNDLHRVQLPQSGVYRLKVFNDSGITGGYSFVLDPVRDQVFNIAIGQVVTNDLPASGAGQLQTVGEYDDYFFTAPTNNLLSFCVFSAANRMFWTLTAPDESTVFANDYLPYNDTHRVQLPGPGTYRLRVFNDQGLTGNYSFQMTDVVDSQFPVTVGLVVTNGVPGAGAGVLSNRGAYNDYLFDAPTNELIYLVALQADNRMFWTLTAPDGGSVFANRYMPYNDIGRVQLPMPGKYRLRIYNDSELTGGYSFQILNTLDRQFSIAIGNVVTNGSPVGAAGQLIYPGEHDDYLFNGTAGQKVFFNALSPLNRLFWTLYAPDGSAVFNNRYLPYNDIGRILLPQTGSYRLRLYNDSGITGGFSFQITTVNDQSFTISPGSTVTNDLPLTGAGNLQLAGEQDDYFFTAPAGLCIYLQSLSSFPGLYWSLTAPDAETVFSGRYMPNNDARRLQLPVPGTYRLRIYNSGTGTGVYSFKLWTETDQSFSVALGEVITNGVPSAGAGILQTPGQDDVYTFSGFAGQQILLSDFNSTPGIAYCSVVAPGGATLFQRYLNGGNSASFTLPRTGTYFLHVQAAGEAVPASYSLGLSLLGSNTVPTLNINNYAISLGTTISNGFPAAGAGNIGTAGEQDIYTFSASPGQVVIFQDKGSAGNLLFYDVYDYQWNHLYGEYLNGNQDLGRQRLLLGGAYHVVVAGNGGSATGDYRLAILPVPITPNYELALGQIVGTNVPGPGAGVISSPGGQASYTFNASAGQAVYFEDLGGNPNGYFRYDVYDPDLNYMFGEYLNGNQDIGRQVLPRSGVYTIIASAYQDASGSYSFAVLPVPVSSRFNIALGQNVSGTLPAAGAQAIYTFAAAPGQGVYFVDQGSSPNGYFRYDVYDPLGNYLFGEYLNGGQDIGRQTLILGGNYTMVLSGYQNATGNFSFALQPIPSISQYSITLNQVVSSNSPAGAGFITVPGAQTIYNFHADAGQVVYFQDMGGSPNGNFRYDVYDSGSNYLFGEYLNGGQDIGRQILAKSGNYQVVVSPYQNVIGSYSFEILTVPATPQFHLTIGDNVASNIPAIGAGIIDHPGQQSVYSFEANPGQSVYFENRGSSPNGYFSYQVFDSGLNALFGETLDGNSRVGLQRLARGGSYRIIVSAQANVTGTFNFKIWDGLPRILQPPVSLRGVVGQSQIFTVQSESPFPQTYQWRFYGTNLPNANLPSLTFGNATPDLQGPYDVIIRNSVGAITSAVVSLSLDSSELYVTSLTPGGVTSNHVSQLRVQFSQPILAGSFTPSDLTITGPSGTLNNSGFSISPVDSQTFLINIPTQTVPGTYEVQIGPGVTNVAGQPMTGGIFVPVYTTDFEAGVGGEWSRAGTLATPMSSQFLGEYDNQTVALVLAGLAPHATLRLKWDLLLLDNWRGDSAGPDYFGFNIPGLPIPAWQNSFCNCPDYYPQSFPGQPTIGGTSFAGNGNADSIYQGLQFDFFHTNDTLEIDFFGRNLIGNGNSGWGIDNVKLYQLTPPSGAFQGRFVIDAAGPALTNVSLAGISPTPISSVDLTFNESIQVQSLTAGQIQFSGPLGVIAVDSPQRLDARRFRLTFPAQRQNGAYALVIGPNVLDLAGNPMAAPATNRFNILTPPIISTQPISQTVVRNGSATFSVTPQATSPVQFQWAFNGSAIAGATDSSLTLSAVQTNQTGGYSVVVTDSGGSVTSGVATLTVLYSYGSFIAEGQAARSSVPAVPGNGVSVQLYNGVGGGPAPNPAAIDALIPSGTTLSPYIQFPNPGPVIEVGNSFDTFFEPTTVPPDQVSGLSALNFTLAIRFYLRVTQNLDLHPETPEIDVNLGVGSDDGYYLMVGTNSLGSAGDRGFNYTYSSVSFEGEGLYPVTLYYDANAVGQSGLQLSWQIGSNNLTQIIPQAALYLTPDLGDRLITFEEFPAGTVLSNQFSSNGVVFTTLSGSPQVTANFPTRFVPISPVQVLGNPSANPATPDQVQLSFVAPGSGNPATTEFVSFFLINAINDLATVIAFDSVGQLISSNSYHGGGASQELVTINHHGIARIVIALGQGTNTAAIDNLSFLLPVSLPNLVVDNMAVPATATAGQPVQISWRVSNNGSSPAAGPWTDTITLAPNPVPSPAVALGSFTYSNLLAVGQSLTQTQTVILPPGLVGNHWFVVTADSTHALLQGGSILSHTTVSDTPTLLLAPNLSVTSLTGPAALQFGQSGSFTWVVKNNGTAPATAPWTDQLLLSNSSNGPAGGTLLLSSPAPASLAPGQSYTNVQSLNLPLSASLTPGTYYLYVVANSSGGVAESNPGDNSRSLPLNLTLPLLPDLTVGRITVPPTGTAGQPASIGWSVTNNGTGAANGIWQETVYLAPSGTTLSQFAFNPGAYQLLGAFKFTNQLSAGSFATRTQSVPLPANGLAGNLVVAVLVNSDGALVEQSAANDAAIAATPLLIPPVLTLSVPVTSVPENTANPNLACLVSRNGDLTSPCAVSLTSSATNHLLLPASVAIPAGQTSVQFTARVIDDGLPTADAVVTLSAQSAGLVPDSALITVVNTEIPALALSFTPAQINQGVSAQGRVTRSFANSQPLVVSLTPSTANALLLPATVTIPANSNAASFTVMAVQNTLIQPAQTYSISAAASGLVGGSANLTVLNQNTPVLTLSLDRTNVFESDGPFAAYATITRQSATDQQVVVNLASTNPAAATVPSEVTIPSFQLQVTFPVAAVSHGPSSGPLVTLITGQTRDVFGNGIGAVVSEAIVVQDDHGPSLHVTIGEPVVRKGLNPATKATVFRNTPATNNLVVSLESSNPAQATVPPSVTIPIGQTSIDFNLSSLDDGHPGTSVSLSITANAKNYASGSAPLTVTDINLPDLIISSITPPGSAYTGETVPITFRLANVGLGTLSNSVSQFVYFTTNPVSGNALFAGIAGFAGPLAPGQFVDLTLSVPSSALPGLGSYFVEVVANANGNALELNTANNTACSSTPLAITYEYSATVQAGLATAPVGTPIPLTGSATLTAGGPARNVPVNLLLSVRGLQRTLAVQTDTNGNFSTLFAPLPNEGGNYTVSAVPPGQSSAPPQAQFTIFGMKLNNPSLTLNPLAGGSAQGSVTLQNLTEVPLTGLTATINGLAANLSASAMLATNRLDDQAAILLNLSVTANDASTLLSGFTVHLASAEGAVADLPVVVRITTLKPRLLTTPSVLNATMLVNGQTVVQFGVINAGGVETGPLSIAAPGVSWLTIASTNPLPSLAPGQSNLVTIVLTPGADLPLGPYSGKLSVNCSLAGVSLPFSFDAISDAHGALRINTVDEFTFFGADSPPLTNASITLTDPFTGTVVASGKSDTNGLFVAPSLLAGNYQLDISADKHSSFHGSATVVAARTNRVEAFLSRQTVTFTWSVVPTDIEDVTKITVQAEFEANVPAPVVVPNPTSLDLSSLTQPGQFIDVPLTLANYGLIAVHNVTITHSAHPLYRFDIASSDLGTLAAHASVTVPMRITRVASGPVRKEDGTPCDISFQIAYLYLCGDHDVNNAIALPVFGVTGDCPGNPFGGTIVAVGCDGCPSGGTITIPPLVSTPLPCDPCMAKAIIECAIGFTPLGFPYSVWSCANNPTVENCIANWVGNFGPEGNALACAWAFLRCKCPGAISTVLPCIEDAIHDLRKTDDSIGLGLSSLDPRDVYAARSYPELRLIQTLLGDPYAHYLAEGTGPTFNAWLREFTGLIQPDSVQGVLISPGEADFLLHSFWSQSYSPSDVQNTIDHWNLSILNWRAGIYSPTNVPSGGNTNFMDQEVVKSLAESVGRQYQICQAAGYDSPIGAFYAQILAAEKRLSGGGVCAHVVLEIDQDAVLTRDAFHATLQLNNGSPDPLTSVRADLTVRNEFGQDVFGLFGVSGSGPSVSGGLTTVDGTGSLAMGGSATAQWTLIPTLDAAPQATTNYFVSGTLSFVENGVTITIPLSPSPISVKPSPELYLSYFLQRDVFADDPFTPQIEPSIPFPLVVQAQNKGYGVARNFHITSAEPKIVDNQKGLLVDFKIVNSQVGSQPAAPSLTVNFGDIQPGQVQEGAWYLTSTLQGLFIDYKATYQHVDSLGNPRLSLIQGVDIHEMIHLVRAEGAWDDGLPDPLVQDVAGFDEIPDTLYLSDGTKQPVSLVKSGFADAPPSVGHLEVQFTTTFPAGFNYLLVTDPANGQYPLLGVRHADGSSFLPENFYVTDRTFVGLAQAPIRENKLHLFAYHTNSGPDTVTLVYGLPVALSNTNPPVSSVFSLPANSPTLFGVVWSGATVVGDSGSITFDIYVSDDGGPFTAWQTHTTATTALYNGVLGHTYSFYSIATDTAGLREPVPSQPQARTLINFVDAAPIITITPSVTLNAGETLSLDVMAAALNPSTTLSFTLGPGAPVGAVVDPVTGHLSWLTSPSLGGTTNHITVIATDDSAPPFTGSATVTVVLKSINTAPVLSPISNYLISEGTLLSITNQATDLDVPANTLTYSLFSSLPSTATLDPATGVFQWQPAVGTAPVTNTFTITVTDNGLPPLSASRHFNVRVRPKSSEFLLSLGTTNVAVGATSSVPVVLDSSTLLSNLTAFIQIPSGRLTNLTLLPTSAEVLNTLLQPLGSNLYALSINLNPAASPGRSRLIAQLGFVAAPQTNSQLVLVNLAQPAGLQSDGTSVTEPKVSNGRVFVVANEPLVDGVINPDGTIDFVLFGKPGKNYELQLSPDLTRSNFWNNLIQIPLTNQFQVIHGLNVGGRSGFYRVYQVGH